MLDYYNSLLEKHKNEELFDPLVLQLLITNKCNLECRHCFAWETNNNDLMKDLTFAEYEKIANSMDRIGMLMIGGGEPFLRTDLADVIHLFVKTNGVRSVGIATNGFNPKITMDYAERILKENPETTLGLSFSIDGPKEIHNFIRRNEKAFTNTLKSWMKAKELKEKYGNLAIGISSVVNFYNQDHLDELFEFYAAEMKPDHINVLLVRQSPHDIESKQGIDLNKYERFTKQVESYALKQHYPNEFSVLARASQLFAYRLVARTVKTGNQQIQCMAGRGSVLIDNEGGVFTCEIRKPIANLRQNGYDFKKIFFSPNFDKERDSIKTCICTHETQGLVPSIPFSAAHENELKQMMESLSFKIN